MNGKGFFEDMRRMARLANQYYTTATGHALRGEDGEAVQLCRLALDIEPRHEGAKRLLTRLAQPMLQP